MSISEDLTGAKTSSQTLETEAAVGSEARQLIDNFRSEIPELPSPDEEIDDLAALRWRRALLRLSETFLDAAEERRDLSPILLGALHNALEELLIHGKEDDLMALEEWLGHEAPPPDPIEAAVSEAARAMFSGSERRNAGDRRAGEERRHGERRQRPGGRRNGDVSS
jgi:hypothetical protein